MKVVYISSAPFFDMDLSLLKELFKGTDLHFFLDLPPYSRKSTALDFKTTIDVAGIYPAKYFEELNKFSDYIDLDRMSVIYRSSKKVYSASNLLLQYKFAKLIREFKPDVIHCNNFLNFNFLYFLYSNRNRKVLTVHDPVPHSGEASKKDNAIRKFNYRHISNIILLNNSQTDLFIGNSGKKPSNIFFSRLGSYTYLRKFGSQKKKAINPNQILFFGRISPYKGIEELCKAFRVVIDEFPESKLVIAGSGDFDFNVSEFKKFSNYTFLNRYIPNDELVTLIQESKFVVCPYKDATQSGVIMTSFALDTPVVATNVGGLKEMIVHNQTGLLIEPNSISALADSIIWMFKNPEVNIEMGNNIKRFNLNGSLSWESIVKDLVSIYSKLN
ncbi:hypothetical protein GCM10009119_26910 [Algoriphagus jejuensis]|uniref:Glycosyltransferase involved in cell wall biosynthesis n=1 Tax=Algoriphagus jejuensis TaxID=419934 RepID=A0ABN1N1H8_9BACT